MLLLRVVRLVELVGVGDELLPFLVHLPVALQIRLQLCVVFRGLVQGQRFLDVVLLLLVRLNELVTRQLLLLAQIRQDKRLFFGMLGSALLLSQRSIVVHQTHSVRLV